MSNHSDSVKESKPGLENNLQNSDYLLQDPNTKKTTLKIPESFKNLKYKSHQIPVVNMEQTTKRKGARFRVISLQELEKLVENATSWVGLCRDLGYKSQAGSKTPPLRKYLDQNNISHTHLPSGRYVWHRSPQGKKALALKSKIPKRSLSELLVENSPHKSSYSLKKKLIDEGLLEDKCLHCGILPFYNGKPLSLDLDHINGNHSDNRIENLRVLCPNCHRQTPTFGCKNKPMKLKIHVAKNRNIRNHVQSFVLVELKCCILLQYALNVILQKLLGKKPRCQKDLPWKHYWNY